MRELNIQTDENLVLNGDFTEWPDHWKKNLGRGWLSTQDEIYDDEFTRFLAAGNEASVSQDIIIPKDPGTDAHYVLSSCARHAISKRDGFRSVSRGRRTSRRSGLNRATHVIGRTIRRVWPADSRWRSPLGCMKKNWSSR